MKKNKFKVRPYLRDIVLSCETEAHLKSCKRLAEFACNGLEQIEMESLIALQRIDIR